MWCVLLGDAIDRRGTPSSHRDSRWQCRARAYVIAARIVIFAQPRTEDAAQEEVGEPGLWQAQTQVQRVQRDDPLLPATPPAAARPPTATPHDTQHTHHTQLQTLDKHEQMSGTCHAVLAVHVPKQLQHRFKPWNANCDSRTTTTTTTSPSRGKTTHTPGHKHGIIPPQNYSWNPWGSTVEERTRPRDTPCSSLDSATARCISRTDTPGSRCPV